MRVASRIASAGLANASFLDDLRGLAAPKPDDGLGDLFGCEVPVAVADKQLPGAGEELALAFAFEHAPGRAGSVGTSLRGTHRRSSPWFRRAVPGEPYSTGRGERVPRASCRRDSVREGSMKLTCWAPSVKPQAPFDEPRLSGQNGESFWERCIAMLLTEEQRQYPRGPV